MAGNRTSGYFIPLKQNIVGISFQLKNPAADLAGYPASWRTDIRLVNALSGRISGASLVHTINPVLYNYIIYPLHYCSVSDQGFFPGSGSEFFSESGSGSTKTPDTIRKNPDADP